jgi:exopolysaccharide production protein ExoQ
MSVQGCTPFEGGRIVPPIGRTGGIGGSVRGGLALLLVPALLAAAGIALSSSQDRAVGDLVAQSSSLGGQLTFYYGFVSALIFLSVAALSYRAVVSICRNNLLLCSLIMLASVSCVWSQSPIQTIKSVFLLCASMAFSFWLAVSLSPTQQMNLIIQTGIVAALISIVVVVAIPSRGLDTLHEMAWQGAFFSKNHMGRMFLFFLTPAIHYPVQGRFKTWRGPYIVLMVFMIGMSRSKSALILLGLYLLFAAGMKFTSRFTRRSGNVILLASSIVLAVSAILIMQYLDQLLSIFGADSSLTGRTGIWKVLFISAEKRPFIGFGYQEFWAGTTSEGFNAFVALRSLTGFLGTYAHSGYLAVLLEEGFLGLVLLAAVIAKVTTNAWQCLAGNHEPFVRWYCGIVFLSILYNVDEVTFLMPLYLPWMMFVLAAIGLSTAAARLRADARLT